MAFPPDWPPRVPSSVRSIRVFTEVLATPAFADNAFHFSGLTGADTRLPAPRVPDGSLDPVAVSTAANPGAPGGGSTLAVPVGVIPTGEPVNPTKAIYSKAIAVTNLGANPLEFSFDGTNVHGVVPAGARYEYRDRYESGIAVRSALGTTVRIEAW